MASGELRRFSCREWEWEVMAECSVEHPCPVHNQWAETKEKLHHMFAGRTVAQLLSVAKERELSAVVR